MGRTLAPVLGGAIISLFVTLPGGWNYRLVYAAAFLLAEVLGRVVLELLSGPSAATYVFRGTREEIGADLAALHFRRRGLALTRAEEAGPEGRPYRLALRRLEPLKRLRAATLARLVHDGRWPESLAKALDAA